MSAFFTILLFLVVIAGGAIVYRLAVAPAWKVVAEKCDAIDQSEALRRQDAEEEARHRVAAEQEAALLLGDLNKEERNEN